MHKLRQFSGYIVLVSALLVAAAATAARFSALDRVPPGGQVDEVAGSVTLTCLATEGTDAHGVRWPFFADMHYGSPLSPTHLYLGALWVKAFGGSVASLRALSGVYVVAGALALALVARLMFGAGYAVWVFFFASLSPWTWAMSRTAFESLGVLPGFGLGLFFLLRAGGWRDHLLSALFFALSMYAYPPARLMVPLFLPLALVYQHSRGRLVRPWVLAGAGALALLLLPLAVLTLNGTLTGRFREISIFADDYAGYLAGMKKTLYLAGLFVKNYMAHLSLGYLFTDGGGNGVNLARGSGIFGWHDLLALAAAAGLAMGAWFRSLRSRAIMAGPGLRWGLFLTAGWLLGIVPTALTTLDLPNALRMVVSWPFAVLLTGFAAWRVTRCWPLIGAVLVLTGALFMFRYTNAYFRHFAAYSGGWFQPWVREQARAAQTDEDWLKFIVVNHRQDYHTRYYLMRYHGDTCSSSREKYDTVRAWLRRIGKD